MILSHYALIPITALLIHGFTWTYVFAQRRKNRAARAYLLFVAVLIFWVACNIVFKSGAFGDWLVPLFKINSAAWLFMGFLILNFTYAFFRKEKDAVFYGLLVLSTLAVMISLGTKWVVNGYIRYYWGANQRAGFLLLPFAAGCTVSPVLYAIYLFWIRQKTTNDAHIKKQYAIIIWGFSTALAIGLTSVIILPDILNLSDFIQVTAEASVFQSLAIYWAIVRHNFMALETADIADILLFNTKDGVVLADREGKIVQHNKAAGEWFGPLDFSPTATTLDKIIPGYHEIEGKARVELDLMLAGTPKTVLLTQVTIERSRMELGKILIFSDITASKKAEEALQAKIIALTQPAGDLSGLRFEDLFDVEELQKIQDAFSEATGVASVIVGMDGRPITRASNFCRLCHDIIRKTKKGLAKCIYSDSVIGRINLDGPNIGSCLSAGLLNGGASIVVGNRHIAKWLVGEVIAEETEEADIGKMLKFAAEIGADADEYRRALAEVPRISRARFHKICWALFLIARQMSTLALQNMQQARDIMERRRAEEALRESEEHYRYFFDNSPDAIFLFSPQDAGDWIIIACNDAACAMHGYTRAELIGRPMNILFADPQLPGYDMSKEEWSQCLKKLSREKGINIKTIHQRKDGTNFYTETTMNILSMSGQEIVMSIDRDVTDRMKADEIIRYQAFHDLLTGLPNRNRFNEKLSKAISEAGEAQKKLAILFLDLDRFKTINDTLGHATGDRLLQDVATRLLSLLEKDQGGSALQDLARLGGDEFIILLPRIDRIEEAREFAQKVLDNFTAPHFLDDAELHTTASIGIAIFPEDAQDPETLLQNADIALYRAKQHGRNNYQFYTHAMNTGGTHRLELENSLRHALERNQLFIHYQPQLNIKTLSISGVEALLRWKHHKLDLIDPGLFIPAAEETGTILPMGEWVLRTACSCVKAWRDAGYPYLRLAVNLSTRQFQQPNLVNLIDKILSDTGFDPRFLELEMVENTVMQNMEYTVKILHELTNMGMRIALDDFGIGYSSLNYLKKFPLHTLKIDKTFVQGLTGQPKDISIAEAIISLAHNLGLEVIAEGVETVEQLALLKLKGCDCIQGYLFREPVSPEEFHRILKGPVNLVKDRPL
ncbi:MAG: EAL domain-containing protein [Bacillota bacterium]